MARSFLADDAAMLTAADGKHALLWGDPVEVLPGPAGGPRRVRAHGAEGELPAAVKLVDELALLELYVIDVGQGDGILLHTPDDRWHVVDGGPPWSAGMLRKGAASFLAWKFARDLGRDVATFENVIVSHSDLDHFGGVTDVLRASLGPPPRPPAQPIATEVKHLWHSGVPRFEGEDIGRHGDFLTELLSGKDSFRNPPRPFAEAFGEFAEAAQVAGDVQRLTRTEHPFLPGYEPGAGAVTIHVLGPVLEPGGLRWLGSGSETINGHSIVLRLDFGEARILLTGDINTKAQRFLLDQVPAAEFAADVAKGCHHGAEDVLPAFFAAMAPRATIISSGDNEGHAHPRPAAVGAYGRNGRFSKRENSAGTWPPLVYMTEVARSIRLDTVSGVRVANASAQVGDVEVRASSGQFRPLASQPIATDLVYGLVNIRTDGRRILCATRNEGKATFDVKVFRAGVDVP